MFTAGGNMGKTREGDKAGRNVGYIRFVNCVS